MSATAQRYTLMLAAFACLAPVGCRGSKPFSRFVQITPRSDADLPEVDPPNQRLATSQPRLTPEVTISAEETRSPHVDHDLASRSRDTSQRSVANRAPTPTRNVVSKNAGQPRSDVRRTLSSLAGNESTRPSAGIQQTASSKRPSSTPVAETRRTNAATNSLSNTDSLADADPVVDEHADLLAAFGDYPPEVQKEALRRLLAATARRAEKTDQPAGLDEAIQGTISDLPKLPAPRRTKSPNPATRLASGPKSEPTENPPVKVAATAAPQAPPAAKSKPEPVATPQVAATQSKVATTSGPDASSTPEPAQPEPAQPEPAQVVQSVSESPTTTTGGVQPASASRDGNEPEMVAQAVLDSAATDAKDRAPSLDPAGLESQVLYQALLKKLAVAPEGESESARASRLIKLRHMMVLSGNVDDAVKQIDGMSNSEQEFLRHQLLGLWTMVDPSGHPVASRRITTALPQLREATKFAAAATDSLDVRSLSFCTEIESYGQIKPFAGNRFAAGQQVILYCEIENFVAKKTDAGYMTHLQGSYDIYNSENEKVVSQLLPADQQNSANYLRDYFIAYQMHLPKQLSAGTYRLQLTMEDVGGKKYGQANIPFEIAK